MKCTAFTILFLLSQNTFSSAQLNGFTLNGNPQSSAGATWTFQDSVNGIWYDMKGILFEPSTGAAVYPAVIINHGTGGNVNGYSKAVAQEMVTWGFVCIATNLCHSGGVPVGSPGDTSMVNWGASANNYLRDMMCWNILASLSNVDTNCIMAFGHSRGAYTTTGLVASYPAKFSCAGHTAGGAIPQTGYSAPSTTLAAQISCPYIIHHGDSDMVVPVFYDSTLNNVFDTTGIPHQFYVYPGLSHSQMSMDSVMYVRTQSWFLNHLCITSGVADVVSEQMPFNIFPNPFRDQIIIQNPGGITHLDIYDLAGRRVYDNQDILPGSIPLNLSGLDTGIYLVRLSGAATSFRKIIKK